MKKLLPRWLAKLGPGFITGASDDDPSGIATYSQTGAMFGYNQLWLALFSLPFMVAVQEMCGRIGMVSGIGLAGNIRRHYSRGWLYLAVSLLFVANTINIGADLGAMAASVRLFVDVRFEVLLLGITVVSLLLQIFVTYKVYAKFLKYLTLSLLAYVVTAFVIRQPWLEIGYRTVIPNFAWSAGYLMNIVAVLGTTISPYLFFWQADEEVEEAVARRKLPAMGAGRPKVRRKDVDDMRQDTLAGMFFSNLAMFFIIVTTASTLGAKGGVRIETAADAAAALEPLAGRFAFLLFALGIVGTGLLAVPVLAGSASYALAESFHWKEGLYLKFRDAVGFYAAIAAATILGLVTNFLEISSFRLLYYSAVLNGIAAPPLMVLILLISNNKRIMGEHTSSRRSNVLGVAITVIMGVAGAALLFQLVRSGGLPS